MPLPPVLFSPVALPPVEFVMVSPEIFTTLPLWMPSPPVPLVEAPPCAVPMLALPSMVRMPPLEMPLPPLPSVEVPPCAVLILALPKMVRSP